MALINIQVSKGFLNRTTVQLSAEADPMDIPYYAKMARKALKECNWCPWE